MKKIFFIAFVLTSSIVSFGQTQAVLANKPLAGAQKAATELSRLYNLTAEQAVEVKKIQDSKFEALAKLEVLKNIDLKKYIAKRLSTFETADNALMVLLDERQLSIFKQQLIEKADRYETIVSGMKKQGISQTEIDKKLAEAEF